MHLKIQYNLKNITESPESKKVLNIGMKNVKNIKLHLKNVGNPTV